MMANALQLPKAATSTVSYGDVSPTDWFYNAIMRARSSELLNKFTGDDFSPNQAITRGEMTVILAAILRKHGFNSNSSSISTFEKDFMDANSISSNNRSDAALVYSLGILQGIPDINGNGIRYSPNGNTTRAQAATVQIRLLEILNYIN
jgi:hypothetical protein